MAGCTATRRHPERTQPVCLLRVVPVQRRRAQQWELPRLELGLENSIIIPGTANGSDKEHHNTMHNSVKHIDGHGPGTVYSLNACRVRHVVGAGICTGHHRPHSTEFISEELLPAGDEMPRSACNQQIRTIETDRRHAHSFDDDFDRWLVQRLAPDSNVPGAGFLLAC